MNLKTVAWLGVFCACLAWSAVDPHDRVTWWLEVSPAIIGLVILAATRKRFPLTSMLYLLILVHSVILMVGGHYTYAEVPAGEWFREWSGSDRNDYDKLGHFAQGFIPAMIAREVLHRNAVVKNGAWLFFIVLSICLGFSAFYELLEWTAALVSRDGAEAFLGMQGYEWDTQSDMMWALAGALLALLTLSRIHDRQMTRLAEAGN